MTIPANTKSMLDAVEHSRILADLEGVCLTASLPQIYLHHSMAEFCNPIDMDWVKNFKQYRSEGVGGLLLLGASAETRSMAICGALIRNFIDARIMTLNALIEDKERQDPTVLVVPNLFFALHGKPLTSWQIQTLYDALLHRLTVNKPTVVYVESMASLRSEYGPLVADHIETHFLESVS
jgi:hypothetical protein